jgi:hypothetical protein
MFPKSFQSSCASLKLMPLRGGTRFSPYQNSLIVFNILHSFQMPRDSFLNRTRAAALVIVWFLFDYHILTRMTSARPKHCIPSNSIVSELTQRSGRTISQSGRSGSMQVR